MPDRLNLQRNMPVDSVTKAGGSTFFIAFVVEKKWDLENSNVGKRSACSSTHGCNGALSRRLSK